VTVQIKVELNICLINLTLFSPCNIVMLFITITNNFCTNFINTHMSLNPKRVSVPGGPTSTTVTPDDGPPGTETRVGFSDIRVLINLVQ
jgi:hypothetical protein